MPTYLNPKSPVGCFRCLEPKEALTEPYRPVVYWLTEKNTKLARQHVNEFCPRPVGDSWIENDDEESLPYKTIRALADDSLFGTLIPSESALLWLCQAGATREDDLRVC